MTQQASRLKARRKLWLRVHLILGLSAGAVFAVISLSGSLIVFAAQLDAWLNSDTMRVEVPAGGGDYRPFGEILAAARSALPNGAKWLNRLSMPQHAHDVVTVPYRMPPSNDTYQIFVNPYTGMMLGRRLWGGFNRCCSAHGPLMAMVYRFHDSFWLGALGSVATGAIALLAIASLVSGVVHWRPRLKRMGTALSIKRRASAERLNYDLHKVTGVYATPVLFVLLFTGAYLSLVVPFPKPIKGLVGLLGPLTEQPKSFESVPIEGREQLSLKQAMAVADRTLPDGAVTLVFLTVGETGVYQFLKHRGSKIQFPSRQRRVVVDAYSGDVLYRSDTDRQTAADVFVEWQLALHSGEAFGLTGQLLVLIAGLVPPALFVTGFIRWLQKPKAHRIQVKKGIQI